MHIQQQRITIINIRRPSNPEVNAELQWFGDSLGLFNLRDKDKSCFRIFIELLKSSRGNIPVSSDDLALRLDLSRGTIIHHIEKLQKAGLVIEDHNRYYLRVDSLEMLINELERDAQRIIIDLRAVAKDLDKKIGL